MVKEGKQMIKCVHGKQTQSSHEMRRMFAERVGCLCFGQNVKWTNVSRQMEECGAFMSILSCQLLFFWRGVVFWILGVHVSLTGGNGISGFESQNQSQYSWELKPRHNPVMCTSRSQIQRCFILFYFFSKRPI